jgi:hypothetical protein
MFFRVSFLLSLRKAPIPSFFSLSWGLFYCNKQLYEYFTNNIRIIEHTVLHDDATGINLKPFRVFQSRNKLFIFVVVQGFV